MLNHPKLMNWRFAGRPSFAPDQITGLNFAIRPDQGVSTDVNGITAVTPAWGTSIGVTASGTTEPDLAAAFGPLGQDLFKFTKGNAEFFLLNSTVNLTTATFCFMIASADFTATTALLGNTVASNFIRYTANLSSVQFVTIGGANTPVTFTAGKRPYKQMLPVMITYDANDNGGTANIYVNNVLSGTAVVGNGGFAINRIGISGAATSPFDGYMGPVIIYNRVLTLNELTGLYNYLLPWRGDKIYIANSGSDSSLSPWNSTTPMLTMNNAFAIAALGYETYAPKGGDIFRLTSQTNASALGGYSNGVRMSIDGSIWGVGKAQMRSSSAPAPTLVSGTVYDMGAIAATPFTFVYYIPGGTITFGANFTLGNIQRLTQDSSTPGTPALGKWGYTGGHVFVNAGVALAAGDIEIPITGVSGVLRSVTDNYNFKNMIEAFSIGTIFTTDNQNITLDGIEAYFGQADGIDTGVAGTALNINVLNCITAWNGTGPSDIGSSAGDGYSMHSGQINFSQCQAWHNDKAGFDHLSATTSFMNRCLSVGSYPYSCSNAGTGGSYKVTNSIGVVTTDAFNDSACSMRTATITATIENCTFYQLKTNVGQGIEQFTAGGNLIAINNIVQGFANGLLWTAGGTINADYNDYYNNTNTYSNTSAGAHDLLASPLLIAPNSFNFNIPNSSPAAGHGQTIAGIITDYAGTTRKTPTSIGAYEAPA